MTKLDRQERLSIASEAANGKNLERKCVHMKHVETLV